MLTTTEVPHDDRTQSAPAPAQAKAAVVAAAASVEHASLLARTNEQLRYPATITRLLDEVRRLVLCGSRAKLRPPTHPKPDYFLHYEIVAVNRQPCTAQTKVPTNMTALTLRCTRHGIEFSGCGRLLTGTSPQGPRVVCPQCEKDSGVTVNERRQLLKDVVAAFEGRPELGWRVEGGVNLSAQKQNSHCHLNAKDRLHLICRRPVPGTTEACGRSANHTLGNINYMLNASASHLRCQGRCRSSPRGYSTATPIKDADRVLCEATGGQWALDASEGVDRNRVPVTQSTWVIHTVCGERVFRRPMHLMNLAAKGTPMNCPFCARTSSFEALQPDPAVYDRWLRHISRGAVALADPSKRPARPDSLAVICLICESRYTTSETKVLTTTHHDCSSCGRTKRYALRAWSRDEAAELLRRRDYELLDDPGSYREPARLRMPDGAEQSSAILDVLRKLPARTSPRARAGARTRAIRHDAFRSLGVAESYIAGLLATDGTIGERGRISIELKAVDEQLLVWLGQHLCVERQLTYRSMNNVQGRGVYAALRFCSQHIAADLREIFGIVPRKSLVLEAPPRLPDTLHLPYLVGLIEGDGTVSITHRRYPILGIRFSSASPPLIDWVCRTVDHQVGVRMQTTRIAGKSLQTCSVTGSAAETLGRALLAIGVGRMKRKWAPLRAYLALPAAPEQTLNEDEPKDERSQGAAFVGQ